MESIKPNKDNDWITSNPVLFLHVAESSCVAVGQLPVSPRRRSCISTGLIQWQCDIILYLSEPVLLSSPPAPRFHSGRRRTSRKIGSPGSSSSLHGGSGPACTQPSSHQCPLRCVSGKLVVSVPSSNAATTSADSSGFRRKHKYGCKGAGAEFLWTWMKRPREL